MIGYHQYLRLLASHRLDPFKALNLRSVCSQQLHGNLGPCTGYVFVLHKRRWIRTGLTCTQNQTPPEELGMKIQEASNTYWNKLKEKNKTSLQRISNIKVSRNVVSKITQLPTPQPAITAQPLPLPRINNAELYTIHDEPMPL